MSYEYSDFGNELYHTLGNVFSTKFAVGITRRDSVGREFINISHTEGLVPGLLFFTGLKDGFDSSKKIGDQLTFSWNSNDTVLGKTEIIVSPNDYKVSYVHNPNGIVDFISYYGYNFRSHIPYVLSKTRSTGEVLSIQNFDDGKPDGIFIKTLVDIVRKNIER